MVTAVKRFDPVNDFVAGQRNHKAERRFLTRGWSQLRTERIVAW